MVIASPATLAEALFVSAVQPSQQPTSDQIAAAIEAALHRHGELGCACACAAEFGEHPDTASERMRWALAAVAA